APIAWLTRCRSFAGRVLHLTCQWSAWHRSSHVATPARHVATTRVRAVRAGGIATPPRDRVAPLPAGGGLPAPRDVGRGRARRGAPRVRRRRADERAAARCPLVPLAERRPAGRALRGPHDAPQPGIHAGR